MIRALVASRKGGIETVDGLWVSVGWSRQRWEVMGRNYDPECACFALRLWVVVCNAFGAQTSGTPKGFHTIAQGQHAAACATLELHSEETADLLRSGGGTWWSARLGASCPTVGGPW